MRNLVVLCLAAAMAFCMARPALAQDEDGLQVGDVVVRLTAMEGPAVQLDFMKEGQTRTWSFTIPEWEQFLVLFRNTARTDNYDAPDSRGLPRDTINMGEIKGLHFVRYIDPEYGITTVITDGKHTLAEFDGSKAHLFFERGRKMLPPGS